MSKSVHQPTGAFSLVEVVMAIGVVSFALLMLVALLPVGLKTARESSDEAAAINHLSTIAVDVRNIPFTNLISSRYGIPVWKTPASPSQSNFYLNDGGDTTTDPAQAAYSMEWRIVPPAGWSNSPRTQVFAPVHVNIRVGWPARSSPPLGYVETVVAIPSQRR